MALSHAQARHFYDRFGKRQDSQWFYEDRALDLLVEHAAFDQAAAVAELGCGTGRFAERLLRDLLPSAASYIGIDVSETMVSLARQRLLPFGARAQVVLSDGTIRFPLPEQSLDRLVATYVFDLLSEADMLAALAEARRLLVPGGSLCLISLTRTHNLSSRLICGLWDGLYRLNASLVGGCRPIQLTPRLQADGWTICYHTKVVQWGVPSEVVIATPAPP